MRHLIKPIRKNNELALVTIIRQMVRTGIRLNRKYKYLNINDKFIRKYVPRQYRNRATRLVRIGEGVALGIPIYEAIESGLQSQRRKGNPPNRKTRNYMVPASRGQKYSRGCRPAYMRKKSYY